MHVDGSCVCYWTLGNVSSRIRPRVRRRMIIFPKGAMLAPNKALLAIRSHCSKHVNPMKPLKHVNATKLVKLTNALKPVNPTKPLKPVNHMKPMKHVNSTKPLKPVKPVNHTKSLFSCERARKRTHGRTDATKCIISLLR